MNRNIANSQIRKAVSNDFKDVPAKQKIHLSLFSALNLLPTAHFNEARKANGDLTRRQLRFPPDQAGKDTRQSSFSDDNFSDYMERAPGAHPKDTATASKATET